VTVERGIRRILVLVSVLIFLVSGWSVWNVVDRGRTLEALGEARREWMERECPRILATETTGRGYAGRPMRAELDPSQSLGWWVVQ
jgi:hypothetical protein